MLTYFIVIIALALIFVYINGFHDAANSIATVVSTKVLTPLQAVSWAAVFNFVAYFIFKDHGVANTVSQTVFEGSSNGVPNITLTVIASGLIAAILWNLITWWYGIPSSSSHALIGGFSGAAIAHAGFEVVNSGVLLKVAAFIFIAPIVGMIAAFLISAFILNSFKKSIYSKLISIAIMIATVLVVQSQFVTSPMAISGLTIESSDRLVVKSLLNNTPAQRMGFKVGDQLVAINDLAVSSTLVADNLLEKVKTGAPVVFSVIREGQELTIRSDYKRFYVNPTLNKLVSAGNVKWLLVGFIIISVCIFSLFLSSLNYARSERWFKRMQLLSSAAFSIGYGGNDSQKVIGIIAVALIAAGEMDTFNELPDWVALSCYSAIALGTLSGGWKIIKTMGTRITKVTPFEGVAAETAGALTLFMTEMLKIPVSTTHTITGSIIGVGATKRLSAVRWGVTINLLWAWIITIPVSALFAGGVYYLLSFLLPFVGVDTSI